MRAVVRFCSIFVTALAVPVSAAPQQVHDLSGRDALLPPPTPVWEAGGMDAPEWAAFASLVDASFDPAGRLYLLDARADRVILVDRDGRFVRQVGRSGEGPGEYQLPVRIETAPDGGLVLWDARVRGFLLWDSAGEALGTVRHDYALGQPRDFQVRPGGDLVAGPRMLVMNGRHAYFTSAGVHPAGDVLPILRFAMVDGAPAQVLFEARMPGWDGSGDPPMLRFFETLPSWGTLAGGRLAVHDSPEYEVRVVAPEGTVEAVLRRPFPAERVGRADRERMRERERERVRSGQVFGASAGGGAPPDLEEPIRDAHFADRIPAVRRIVTDRRGTIWVEREREDRDPDAPGPVDVLAPDGRYLGSWPADGPGIPAAFGPDGLAVWLVEGELDVPIARVMRLPEPLR